MDQVLPRDYVNMYLGEGEGTVLSINLLTCFPNLLWRQKPIFICQQPLWPAVHCRDGTLHLNEDRQYSLPKKSLPKTPCDPHTEMQYGSLPLANILQITRSIIKEKRKIKTKHCASAYSQFKVWLLAYVSSSWSSMGDYCIKVIWLQNACNTDYIKKISCSYETIPTVWHHLL